MGSNHSYLYLSTAGIAERQGRFLVARRKAGGDLGGMWEFPGGKVEAGESPQDGLVREFMEELSISIEVGNLIFEGEFRHHGKQYSLQAYRVELLSDDFLLNEHEEVRWVELNELKKLELAPSDRGILGVL